MTRRSLPLFERLRVRTPCDVGWDAMGERGRDRHRHCAQCELTVHDVAAMTRAEVEDLLEARERGERVCLHLHVRRSDGAVLVADGHVERASSRRGPPSRVVAAVVATATTTAMTACSPATSPPEAPHAEIAIAPATSAPPVIEMPAPPALPPASAPPEPPAMPAPERPAPERPAKKIAAPAASPAPSPAPNKKPPSKKVYLEIDGDAW